MNIAQIATRKKAYGLTQKLLSRNIVPLHEPNEDTARAIEESFNPQNLIECENFDDMLRKCGLKCCG